MSEILEVTEGLPFVETLVSAGTEVIRQESPCHELYVLVQGSVEVLRDGQLLAVVDEEGALFGELSLLLKALPVATVRAVKPCKFRVIHEPALFHARLQENLPAGMAVLRMLARRLSMLDSRFDTLLRQGGGA
jgi:CRP/FNR family transcriptional regulator, cyclic AMP receptor protein